MNLPLQLYGERFFMFIGILIAIFIYIISRKVSRRTLLWIAAAISLICIGIIIYSINFVDSWVIFGTIFYSINVFLGTMVGTIIGIIKKK
ncbi:MAG: hypothetical protein ACTHVM_06980 [Alkalibacterium gilvum]|uniref:hypothetical protein n=1 Tax=Alkalibacterium gilvum TaxID=1130080 RepID=UPI003F92E1AF